MATQIVLSADFDSGLDGFVFQPNAFQLNDNAAYESGQRVTSGGVGGSGALEISLGGIDDVNIVDDMSGAFQNNFTLLSDATVTIAFTYNLTAAAGYEPDEFSQLLYALDGGTPVELIRFTGDGDGGPDMTTGLTGFISQPIALSAGTHTLAIGGLNNKKTFNDEITTILIDALTVSADDGSGPPPGEPVLFEVEAMSLAGLTIEILAGVSSNDQHVRISDFNAPPGTSGTATATFTGASGTYDVLLAYYDENDGQASIDFSVSDDSRQILLDQDLGSPVASAATRVETTLLSGITIDNGDTITLTGTLEGQEFVRMDLLTFQPVTIGPNDPPDAVDDPGIATDEDAPVTIAVLANDSDPDLDPLTVTGVDTSGTQGQVSVNPDGTIDYDPGAAFQFLDQGESATDSFEYSISDGRGGNDSATVTVTVDGLDDDPLLQNPIDDQVSTEAEFFSYTFAADTFLDPAGGGLSYTASLADGSPLPAWLNFDGTTRSFSGTPGNGDLDILPVKVEASDGDGAPASAFFNLFVNDAGVQVSKTQVLAGEARYGITSIAVGPDGHVYASDVLGTIQRYEIDPVTGLANSVETVFSQPGALIAGITFDPDATANDLDLWVSYTFVDGVNLFAGNIARLSIPGLGEGGPTQEQVFITGLPNTLTGNHVPNGLDFGPDGKLYHVIGGNTTLGGTPNWGADETLLSGAVVVADVKNDPAFAGPLPINVQTEGLANNYDPFAPGAPLQIVATGLRNAYDLEWHSNGSLYTGINANSIEDTFTPADPTNGIPAITDLPHEMFARVESGAYYGHPNPTRGEFVLNGGNPTASQDPWESTAYPVGIQPDPDFDPSLVLDIRALGGLSPNGLAEYTAEGALDGRILISFFAGAQSIHTLTLDASGNVAYTSPLESPAGSPIAFNSPLDLAVAPNGWIYVADFGLSQADPSNGAIFVLKPLGPNQAPTAVNDPNGSTDEDTPVTIAVLANDSDPDLDPLTVTGVDTSGTQGQVQVNPDGTIDYDPGAAFQFLNQGESATDSFEYSISDGRGGADSATVTVTVDGLDEPPGPISLEVEDMNLSGLTVETLAGVSSGDQHVRISDFGAPAGTTGTASSVFTGASGTYDVILAYFDENDGQSTIDITIGDDSTSILLNQDLPGGGASAATRTEATVLSGVTVNNGDAITLTGILDPFEFARMDVLTFQPTGGPANQAPTAVNDPNGSTDEDNPVTIAVLANDSDPDLDPLTVTGVNTSGTQGQVSINPNGTVDYDPGSAFQFLNQGESATDSFEYSISDGRGGADSATVTVTVDGLDEPPGPISLEVEDMSLAGLTIETLAGVSSGDQHVRISDFGAPAGTTGTASSIFTGASGSYDVILAYFDENDGQSTIDITIGNDSSQITLDQDLAGGAASAATLTQATVLSSITIDNGDAITLTATLEGQEFARMDLLTFQPDDPLMG